MTGNRKTVIVVEDDERQRGILESFLTGRGYRVRPCPDAEAALEVLEEASADLVLMDVRLPGLGGMEGLTRMRDLRPTLPVVLVTAYADVRDAVEAMRRGAVDYLEKPIDLQELATVVAETIGGPAAPPTRELPPLPEGFIAASPALEGVLREADLVASTDATVLITGESGTGKERIAEFIHRRSNRSGAPLVAVNCAAIPHGLVESELFGHTRGAFTGAHADQAGRFEAAAGGTLLLDEVGELLLDVQPKLLRVLEDGTYQRVGESVTRRTDVRVIASTNRDLEAATREGRFREDLFWRLNVFRIHLPPLRERRQEITALARVFLARAGREKARLSPATVRDLEAYPWPGNIRELANVVERAAILAPGPIILPEHLPASIRSPARHGPVALPPGDGTPADVTTVEEAERRAIREALQRTDGNRTEAAKLLGISRRKLFYRLKQYGGEP
jgi:DNA-binding NtrC family response regulator